jgi:hypothetical protein
VTQLRTQEVRERLRQRVQAHDRAPFAGRNGIVPA